MAQPTNTFDSYDAVGIREDLSDIITNVSPEETPFHTKSRKTTARNTLVEWQTDALRSSAANAHIEGDETTANAMTATSRLNNRTQIFKNAVTVPDTDEGLDKAGRQREMAYQVLKIAKEQKLDIEKALFDNNAKVAGNASTARELAGAPSWMITNVDFQSGNSGANPTGDGTDARTDDGTPTAFTQTKFDTVMQSIWENGGNPDSVYLSAFQMNVALALLVTTTSVHKCKHLTSVLSKACSVHNSVGNLLSSYLAARTEAVTFSSCKMISGKLRYVQLKTLSLQKLVITLRDKSLLSLHFALKMKLQTALLLITQLHNKILVGAVCPYFKRRKK